MVRSNGNGQLRAWSQSWKRKSAVGSRDVNKDWAAKAKDLCINASLPFLFQHEALGPPMCWYPNFPDPVARQIAAMLR